MQSEQYSVRYILRKDEMKRGLKPRKSKVEIPKTYVPPIGKQPPVEEPEEPEVVLEPEEEEKPKERVRKRVETGPKRDLTKDILLRIAKEAYEDTELPEFVYELAEQLTLDDADVFWEFASLVHSPNKVTDFYTAIKEELAARHKDPNLSGGKISHYHSFCFASPMLAEQRKVEEDRDGQLLRKDKPVRGAIYCSRCGDNLISTRQIQLRGLDEPSTNIYTCYTCSNLWSV